MIRNQAWNRFRTGSMLATAFVLCATACAGPGLHPGRIGKRAEPLEPLAEKLLPVDRLAGSLWLRQHVTVRWSGGEEAFDAVLQKREGRLLLLGLGPMNTPGFRLELGREGVVFENRSGRPMPFQPEHILADVQRVFYPWIDGPDCSGCVRRARRSGLDVVERIGDRHLEERRFRDSAHPDRGEIVIRYETWRKGESVPTRVNLHNAWYGYALEIETLASETLDRP
ncbi:MAG TPA: DUF3261 domain-containing protein [Deltaproteobacteria bacterium]|nr:DUF3261 domain-containing protein [Deltaproteobacteria bacterium]